MAYGSPIVVRGRTLLNPFLVFLQRLALEIEEDQFQSMKFLLNDTIPQGILEKCRSARDLFSRMQQKCILGEQNLDLLEDMMISVDRTDLAKRVKAFKDSRSEDEIVDATGEQMRSELPANGKTLVYFSIAGKASEFNETTTLDKMKHCLCEALATKLSEISFVGREENTEDSFFRVIFQIPNRESLLDTLCKEASCEKEWLRVFGIKQVQVEGRALIALGGPPVTRFQSRRQVSKNNSSTSMQLQRGNSIPAMCRFQDERKLDLIVIVECTMVNKALVKQAKTQLIHLVDMIHNNDLNLQMALVSYKDHPRQTLAWTRFANTGQSEKIAHCQGFTSEKDKMKTWIKELNGKGRGSSRGLADGLDVALKLVGGYGGGGVHGIKGRCDAIKICLLLPVLYEEGPIVYQCNHGNDVMKLCSLLAENAVTLYTVGISQPADSSPQGPSVNLISDFFEGISLKTGGRCIRTGNVKDLPEIALHVVEENASMERLIGTTNDIVMEEVRRKYGDVNIEQLTQKLQQSLNRRSCRSSQMQLNGISIGPTSNLAKKFSWDNSIADAQDTFERALKESRPTCAQAGIPLDMDSADTGTGSPRVSLLKDEKITTEVSERMVRKVAQRSAFFKPS